MSGQVHEPIGVMATLSSMTAEQVALNIHCGSEITVPT